MPSKPSTFGLPSDALTTKLNEAINTDYKDRKRSTKLPDGALMQMLHAVCAANVKNPSEVVCTLRRFLTCRYGMTLEKIDLALKDAEILADVPTMEMEPAV